MVVDDFESKVRRDFFCYSCSSSSRSRRMGSLGVPPQGDLVEYLHTSAYPLLEGIGCLLGQPSKPRFLLSCTSGVLQFPTRFTVSQVNLVSPRTPHECNQWCSKQRTVPPGVRGPLEARSKQVFYPQETGEMRRSGGCLGVL